MDTKNVNALDKRLLIFAITWIILALIGAALTAYLLNGSIPYFTFIWLLVPLVVLFRSRDVQQIGIRPVSIKGFVGITAAALAAQLVVTCLFEPWSHTGQKLYSLALSSPMPDTTFLLFRHFGGLPGYATMLVYSSLVSVFAEELFFRGWLLLWLLQHLRSIWAIAIQAAVFTVLVNLLVALIMPPMQAIIYLLSYSWLSISIVNGWAAVKTRSIWPGLIASVLGVLLGTLSASM